MVINVMSGSSDEVPFRVEWLNLIEGLGLRIGHSPNIQEDMMDGGPMDVDYGQMVRRAESLMDALEGAVSVHITAPAGSDFSLDMTGRRFVTDVKITEEERGVNLPCGEIYAAPVEDGAEGVVVADGSIGGEGPPPSPVSLTLKAGRVETVHCADEAWQKRITELLDIDDGARVIAELGIGLNPGARLVGFMLEDEKAYRTIHVAFGSNEGMPGGVNVSATHIDYLVTMPTMTARFADGSERVILRDGDILP
ncbi:MAG: aminopeptidase [bacterium]|nr:aminopeptidase [bacterium]